MTNKIELRKDLIMVAGILAVLVIFFYKFVFFGMIPLNADWLISTFHPWKGMPFHIAPFAFNNDLDPVLYSYPIKYITIEIMKQGHLPLWNPYILSGCPLWGTNLCAPVNPLNAVFFIFGFAKAWGIFLMLQFAVAGIGMYLFSREVGIARPGAVIASIAFMLHTSFVVWYQTLGYLGPYSWLALALFLLERAFRTKSVLVSFWCGLTVALFFSSGMIQIAVYSAFMWFCYLIFRYIQCIRREPAAAGRYTVLLCAMLLTVMLYSMPELLLEKNCITNSTRVADRYRQTVLYPQELVTYVSPYFYGMKYDGWDVGYGTRIFNRGLIRLSPPYVGMFTIFLAIIGFVTWRKKDKYFYLLFSLGVIIGLSSASFSLIHKMVVKLIPFFESVDHYRILTLYAFSISFMAGVGLHNLSRPSIDKRLCIKTAVISFISVASLFILLEMASHLNAADAGATISFVEKKVMPLIFDKSHNLKSIGTFLAYLGMLRKENSLFLFSKEASIPLVLASFSLILILYILRAKKRNILLGLTMVFAASDLLYYALAFPAYSPEAHVYPQAPSMALLKQSDFLKRVCGSSDKAGKGGDMYPPNTGMMYHLYDIRGYENAGQPKWYYRFIMGDKPDEIVIERFNDYDNKFLSFLGVKYFMTGHDIASENWKLVYDKEIKVYENRKPVSRVFITPYVRHAKGSEEAYAILKSDSFDPYKEVVVEDGGGTRLPHILDNKGIVHPVVTKYEPNEVVIESDGTHSGMLVLSDTFFPGWKAFVDGKERNVLKADYAFRAVRVEKGERVIRFLFRPRLVYELCYACAAVFVIVLSATVAVLVRKARPA